MRSSVISPDDFKIKADGSVQIDTQAIRQRLDIHRMKEAKNEARAGTPAQATIKHIRVSI